MKSFLELLKRHALLIIVIFLVYAVFLDVRMIRTTGDEKVYIAQAIEMNSLGNWFVQTLNGQPDYYKGPLHYILLIIGLKIFGYSLWSALYMNLLFCLAGAISLAEIVASVFPQRKYLSFWAGAAFALNVGIFGHFFASQMEVELAGIFSVAFYFLWRDRSWKDGLAFWILAGFAGWLKSPLHSVLIGTSAIFYWLINKELFSRLKSLQTYLTVGTGVLVCALGYAPAYFLDRTNFIRIYFERETLKPPNGGPWWQSLIPIVSYYLIPWMTIALISYFEGIFNLIFFRKWRNWNQSEKKLFRLGLSTFGFTVIFFCVHPYRGENYTVPVTASIVILVLLFLQDASKSLLKVRNWILGITCLPVLVIPVALQVFSSRFNLPNEIWPVWFMPAIWFFSLLGVGLQVWEHFFQTTDGMGIRATLGNVSTIVVVGLILAIFGEMEVYQLKNRIREDRAQGKNYSIYYWNLNRLIWNEWGLMSLAVHEKILPLLSQQDLENAIQKGDLILARDTDRGREIKEFAKKTYPHLKAKFYDWNRWKTHAQDGAGNSLVGKAWKEKDLSILYDHALIMQFHQ